MTWIFAMRAVCVPARRPLKSSPARIPRSWMAESLGGDGVEQLEHRLVGPVFGILIDAGIAARARGGVHALALAEAVPELLDFLGADVVSAATLLGSHFQSSSSLSGFTPGGGFSLRRIQP